jgi:hypothetical protein
VSAPRLRRALAASAAVHVAVLAGLLALAHPRFQAAPAMRVALLGQPGTAGGPDRSHETSGAAKPGAAADERASPNAVDPGPVSPRPPPLRSSPRTSRRTDVRTFGAEGAGDAAAPGGAEALVSAVQSDVWVLAGAAGAPGPPGAAPATGAAAASTGGPTPGEGTNPVGGGEGAPGGGSLLAALSERLAWSAARCAPAELVRTTRHAVPGVPLHFCLDGAGRPSDIGLLGTTGSDVLDRAARDCVVPGALPLPPVPGCYTVEVRFPTRG